MRLGFNLPQFGPNAGPDGIVAVARRAEEIGYDSLWIIERLLYPVQPRSPYPATADGSLPLPYRRSLDPVAVLAYTAAQTSRARIGSTVLNLLTITRCCWPAIWRR
jgi:alkanesulfonate monooxygenase SsuD/methylene tetrahydromethanopterin reductase-like flavin-dependent oxidoreductase (luciferase family)